MSYFSNNLQIDLIYQKIYATSISTKSLKLPEFQKSNTKSIKFGNKS